VVIRCSKFVSMMFRLLSPKSSYSIFLFSGFPRSFLHRYFTFRSFPAASFINISPFGVFPQLPSSIFHLSEFSRRYWFHPLFEICYNDVLITFYEGINTAKAYFHLLFLIRVLKDTAIKCRIHSFNAKITA